MVPEMSADQPDMFEAQAEREQLAQAPLATRMRPHSLGNFVGQEHILAPGRVLRLAIESDRIPSMVLWGPPGSGKTTLAHIIAASTGSFFAPVSAVNANVADLRRIVQQAKERRPKTGQKTILFIDEIHRFNKAQQDAVLPFVEDGTVTMIGATTENPSFEVISPLLSRSRVFTLRPLSKEDLRAITLRALQDRERGLGALNVDVAPDALDHLLNTSNSDARVALNTLELAAASTPPDETGKRRVTLQTVEDAFQHRAVRYDRAGEQHYDLISAFIKSMRGSDPDAAVYWLALMLEAGEDLMFIARRMVILAAEDVGLADPQALVVAIAAQQAAHFVGMPEAYLPLAECAIYLAAAPKSNSALQAYSRAREAIQGGATESVPLHLRNAVTGLMKNIGYGKDYQYPHSYPGHFVAGEYLPESLRGKRFYYPGDQGYETELARRLREWWGDKKGNSE